MKKREEGKGKRKGETHQFSTDKGGKKREKVRRGDRKDVGLSNGATKGEGMKTTCLFVEMDAFAILSENIFPWGFISFSTRPF